MKKANKALEARINKYFKDKGIDLKATKKEVEDLAFISANFSGFKALR